jgi:RES domain-containing protein
MATPVFRVCRAIHARLDGQGAKLVGGRWNTPGHAVVYMAESIALAVLENLVHMTEEDFPLRYVVVEAIIPESVRIETESSIVRLFGRYVPRVLGDRWILSNVSAVLQVRSAVVRSEYNYLLNPAHSEFRRISVKPARLFNFDKRLL